MVRFASRKTRHHGVLSEDFERELTREVLRTELLRVRALIMTGCVMMVFLTAIYLIDPIVVNRVWRGTEGIVEVYATQGPVLRALADAATDDPEVELVYGGLVQSFVDVTTHHIEAEIEAGRVSPLDAQQTATALVWMMERYLNRSMGHERIQREIVADTLTTIWTRVLYGVG